MSVLSPVMRRDTVWSCGQQQHKTRDTAQMCMPRHHMHALPCQRSLDCAALCVVSPSLLFSTLARPSVRHGYESLTVITLVSKCDDRGR